MMWRIKANPIVNNPQYFIFTLYSELQGDCPSGPADIITDNNDGLLIEKGNTQKLAEAISSLINNDEQRKKMGENALISIRRFSPETIYQLWKEKIFTL